MGTRLPASDAQLSPAIRRIDNDWAPAAAAAMAEAYRIHRARLGW